MRKRWKIIVAFALLGFAVTACFYALGTYHDYTKPYGLLDDVLNCANIILCPPMLLITLLFYWCIDCEVGTPAGTMIFLIIPGLLNAALYAAVAFVILFRGRRIASDISTGKDSSSSP